MDLNKEIKLSELFKRGTKEPKAEGERKTDAKLDRSKERTGLLRKDVKLSFGRGRRGAAEPSDRDKTARPEGPRTPARAPSAAPPLAAVPLMRAFNLLPREDVRQVSQASRPSTAQLALGVVALVAIAALASAFLVMNARVADKRTKVDDLRSQLAARQVPAQDAKDTKGSERDAALVQEREQRTAALATALATRTAWDRLLREFALVLPEDVWLKSLTATGPSAIGLTPSSASPPSAASGVTSFEITGYTDEQSGVALLLSRMAVLPGLTSVRLVSSTTVDLRGEEVIEFRIAATVKPPAGGGTA